MKLMIPLRPNQPLTQQVVFGLRQAIVTGTVKPGDRLPATRDLAGQLNVSRTVILNAFDQLMAEGYVTGKRGSGTFVRGRDAIRAVAPGTAQIALSPYGRRIANLSSATRIPGPMPARRYNFAYGGSDNAEFPIEQWRRLLSNAAREVGAKRDVHAPAAGLPRLRESICDYVRRSRGVRCDPSQVIITNGSQQAIDLIARVLIGPGDAVAVEDPSYQGTRAILAAAGARLTPIEVGGHGIDVEALPASARLLFVTPSHQFPTGAVIPAAQRAAIVAWAERHGAVIVEDDYDSEFSFGASPMESIQSLDEGGRVIYVGSFSRTMSPSLRIGYMVAPKTLVQPLTTAKWLADRQSARLEQCALAQFIASGAYELYLKRLRASLKARRGALIGGLEDIRDEGFRISGGMSGTHIVLWPDCMFDEAAAIAAAAANDVTVYPVSPYFIRERRPGLLLGYSQLRIEDIVEGVRRLSRSLEVMAGRGEGAGKLASRDPKELAVARR